MLLTASQHEELVANAEAVTRELLVEENYDSISNFISFYDAFDSNTETLSQLFRSYSPTIRPKKYTCVGLGLELIRRLKALDKDFPGFAAALTLVSCEESVVDAKEYVTCGKGPEDVGDVEKEHVMVGVHVRVDGRVGVLLADPGYHVARIVTVMADRAYPNTGWFTQSDKPRVFKEYCYTFNPLNQDFVNWYHRTTKDAAETLVTSLVYVARPYLDGVNVTERRNLVYHLRSIIARGPKGGTVAGLFFSLKHRGADSRLTLLHTSGGEERRLKLKFSAFDDPNHIPEGLAEVVRLCNSLMNYEEGVLLDILRKLSHVMANETFIEQVLEINNDIYELSA